MYPVVLTLHLIVCLGLVSVVLVQSGKGGGLAGGAFGAQAQTVFGGRGATDFVTRATIALGVLFFVTSFSLALMTSHGGAGRTRSLVQEQARRSAATAPAASGRAPAAPQGALPSGTPTGSPAPANTPAPITPSAPTPAPGGSR